MPFSLLRGDWWCWMCQDSSMQRVWVWLWVSITMAFDPLDGLQRTYAQQEQRILRLRSSEPDICSLLQLCLESTYLAFKGKVYWQIHGTAMGSPVSVVVANYTGAYFLRQTVILCNIILSLLWYIILHK